MVPPRRSPARAAGASPGRGASTPGPRAAVVVLAGLVGLAGLGACGDPPPGRTYFERIVQPLLEQKCAGNTSGCHRANADDPYRFAAGNLDVTSFASLRKRRDLLAPFGAYGQPQLLIKAVAPRALQFAYGDGFRPLEVLHAGGAVLEVGSDAYFTLQTWLANGATETGLEPPSPARTGDGRCSPAVPSGFAAATYTANPAFGQFRDTVQPILARCAAGSCHGAPQSDFYVTCGDTEEQVAFNFSQAWSFVGAPVDDSQLLRVPLAVAAGGRGHSGGDQLASTAAAEYVALRDWASRVGVLAFGQGDPGKQFFRDHVQPMLVARGCQFQGCHSPAATNDLKLRSGSQGFFSAVSLQRNYDLLRDEFMALEFPDARRGRAGAKTVLAAPAIFGGAAQGGGGIAHRGGPVLETPADPSRTDNLGPADPARCPPAYDPSTATAFCTLQEWLRLERAALGDAVTSMEPGDTAPLVYVERTAASATAGRLEFDAYHPGSDLKRATATFGAGQAISSVGPGASLLTGCPGFDPAIADVQAPDVRHDGTQVAFAMRLSAAEPLGVWVVDLDGSDCHRVTPAMPDVAGLKVHDFDPAWSPDGAWLVFASTRGRSGPTVSRKRFLPQSDLWRLELATGRVEQMTFLSNSEVGPAFMREGRVTMTTEKAAEGFYQLSGRRLNWDLTDYHPLLAQRATSPYADPADPGQTRPSVGYSQATDVREAANGNFLVILSDADAALPGAAGALGVFNRSLGTFEQGRADPGYVPALTLVDPQASGRAGATTGYRGPSSLPDGTILASYAAALDRAATAWDLVSVDPRTGARRVLVAGGGKAIVDGVLAYKSPARALYRNRRQLVFGGAVEPGDPAHGVVHVPSAPLLFTLLTGNLRRGRPDDAFAAARYLAVYAEGLAPAGTRAGNAPDGTYQQRTLLGKAPLAADGSAKLRLPAGAGVVLELQDASGRAVVTMTEEHQLGPGERISMGVKRELFDAVCGGCHGSISGAELDVAVTPDALTGASQSRSALAEPTAVGD